MQAKSIRGNSATEIQAALQQSLADGYKPMLAFVFISIKQDRDAVCQLLQQQEIDIIGAAGDDISFTGTYVFTNNCSTDYGMAALIVNEENITIHGMAISGWKPMGISRIATRTEDNLIYTIDDQPDRLRRESGIF